LLNVKSRQYDDDDDDDDDNNNNNNVPIKMHYFLYARTNALIGGTILMTMSNAIFFVAF